MSVEKYILTEKEIYKMRAEIFGKLGQNNKLVIPKGVIDYLENCDKSLIWKGQVLLVYMGIIISFHEGYYTYRNHHMNLPTIMDFMGVSPFIKRINKEFSKNGYFCKEGYISYIKDMPLNYEYSYSLSEKGKKDWFIRYIMASDYSKEDQKLYIRDLENRVMRSIEPTLHIKGKIRKRGRGYQLLKAPLSKKPNDCISFNYDTISKFVAGELSYQCLFYLAVLKNMTSNGNITWESNFRTSKNQLAKRLKISIDSLNTYHKQLKDELDTKYDLKQKTYKIDSEIKSEVRLELSDII
ncbi:hypothetical protein QOK74_08415 [Staphylococcus saprophyticus]|uniref:hypothetical protein n=1 Tax=Staphylococcus saprophyticus TaxID=29385 RepID=UPI0024C3A3D5|nr:hypothetical protein [Staphylococcus saprophyticus]MDK1672895.1 hypothetical protein [Staphylococcus saprophyticus]